MSSDEMLEFLPELLRAENVEGTSGLFFALERGYVKYVAAYSRLLDRLLTIRDGPSVCKLCNMNYDLMMSKRSDGVPGLQVALSRDRF
ncbi:hypothetical protein [Candidatus Ichthyocystis sparus]|nr:hypothetical protein [Candidatus Ichthyocystis sparus]